MLWFDSYLKSCDLKFINIVKSGPHNINIGITQETILGLIIFCIYISDLPELCPDANL